MNNQFEYKEEYRYPYRLCLNLTDACNLACQYCFVEQNPHYMNFTIAKDAVDYALNNLKKQNKQDTVLITYFGGEPTLMWDEIIVPLTNYIRENDFPIELNMTTNGTLLNKERIQFLKDNKIHPLLSIDGDRKTQEYNRPCHNHNQSSFDLVMKNVPELLKAFPNLTFRSTIYADTVEHTFENYVFAIEQGFHNIFMMPDSRHDWTKKQKDILCNEIDKIFMLNDNIFNKGIIPINFSTIQEMYIKAIYHNNQKDINIKRSVNRCGLGTSMAAVGWDGKIYGCQEQPSNFSENNIFYIGDIYSGINKVKHINLLQEYNRQGITRCENNDFCNSCLLRNECIGFNCPSTSYDLFQNFLISPEINCIWLEKIFINCITSATYLFNNNNKAFIKYLGGEKI